MTAQERHDKYLLEAQALRHYYQIDDSRLYKAFSAFATAWRSPDNIPAEEFTELLDTIDNRLEDICLERKITQEYLEALIEGNEEELKEYRIY